MVEFCRKITENNNRIGNELVDNCWFSDETYIEMEPAHNGQNRRRWSTESPTDFITQRTQNPKKLMVWIGMHSKYGCIYKIFKPEYNLDSKGYNWLLSHFILPSMKENTPKRFWKKMWFQEDGSNAHGYAKINSKYLHEVFENRCLAREFYNRYNKGLNWPSRSPDLSPLDYFLNNHIKAKVWKQGRCYSHEVLASRIHQAFTEVDQGMIKKAIEGFVGRCQQCLDQEGSHFERYRH